MRSHLALFVVAAAACGGPPARYSSREPGCPVRSFPAAPTIAVDELGPVNVDCASGGRSCERQLLDAVCAAGGDVAWGMADNSIGAARLTAHAAHSRRAALGTREPGCAVQLFEDAPSIPTENLGTVRASCGGDDSKEACVRELENQVCSLGGDVLWQVEGPSREGDRQRMSGRAAHTRP
jgi:hypothetical protein